MSVVVTFDESDFEADYLGLCVLYDGPNHVYTTFSSAIASSRASKRKAITISSLLRTIEQNFSLGHLSKNDAGANWFQFLWGRRFEWSAPQNTPFDKLDGPIGAAALPEPFSYSLRRRAMRRSACGPARPITGAGRLRRPCRWTGPAGWRWHRPLPSWF